MLVDIVTLHMFPSSQFVMSIMCHKPPGRIGNDQLLSMFFEMSSNANLSGTCGQYLCQASRDLKFSKFGAMTLAILF